MLFALTLFGLMVCRIGEYFPFLSRVRPVVVVSALAALYLIQNSRKLRLKFLARDRIFLLTAAFFAWAIVTVPFALWKRPAFGAVTVLPAALSLMVIISVLPPRRKQIERFLVGVVMLTCVTAGLAVTAGEVSVGRLGTSGMLDPNDLAGLLATVLPFCVAFAIDGRQRSLVIRVITWGAMVALPFVLFRTGSRGGFVALLLGVLVMLAQVNIKRLLVFAIAAGIALPLLWENTPEDLRGRFESITTLEEDYNVTSEFGRIETWKRGVSYLFSHPITGVGYGNFFVAEGFRLQSLARSGPHFNAHNAFVQAFAELGFLGGILFCLILFEGGKRAFRLWKAGKPEYLASLSAFVTSAMFLSHAYSFTLYGLLGIIVLAARANPGARKEKPARNPIPGPGRGFERNAI